MIWHHIRLCRCEHRHKLHCYARGESQVATFACIRLFRKCAMLPSLHSPNTLPMAIYCNALLMWHKMRATRCQHIKSLCVVDGGQPYIAPGQGDFSVICAAD